MPVVNVYSRSPISHQFKVVYEDGHVVNQVIEGMNKHVIYGANIHGENDLRTVTPRVTQMDEDLFNRIKTHYSNMGHVQFFGGKDAYGIKVEPLIYLAKDDKEATKKMLDYKPIITENEMAIKTKNIDKAA